MLPTIRPATGADVAAIDTLLRETFPAPAEANLVRDLCVDGDMVLMLVAIDPDDTLLGAVAFSRMTVSVGGRPVASVALAPLAVAPAWRRQGVAEALVQAGLDHLEASGIVLCFALGDPAFYARFGFDAAYAKNFESPYAGENLMACPLQGGLMPCGVREEATHAPAFGRLSA